MADPDEMPILDDFEVSSDVTRWKPPPDIEDAALDFLKGVIPVKLRPTDQQIEKYYDKAYNLYKTGRYKEALPYFHILTIVNAKHPKYHMALGACYHMLKEYKTAANCYMISAMLDEYNPIPQYHMAGCLIKMDSPFAALVALEMGYPRCDSSPRYKGLKDRMKLMMERLHKELAEKKAQGTIRDIFKEPPPSKAA